MTLIDLLSTVNFLFWLGIAKKLQVSFRLYVALQQFLAGNIADSYFCIIVY